MQDQYNPYDQVLAAGEAAAMLGLEERICFLTLSGRNDCSIEGNDDSGEVFTSYRVQHKASWGPIKEALGITRM